MKPDSKVSHTMSICHDAYRVIQAYFKQSSQPKTVSSKTRLSWRLIPLFKKILCKLGLEALVERLWQFFLGYFYESLSKNVRVDISLGTVFYGLTEYQTLDDVYDMLEDDESRDVFNWFLKYRMAYVVFGPVAAQVFPYLDRKSNANRTMIQKKGKFCKVNGYIFDYRHNWKEVENTWINEQYALAGKCEPRKGDVVIDAGGFQGGTAIWFADKVGGLGRVYSFEPLDSNKQMLMKNIERNHLENIVQVIDEGLWDQDTRLYITNNGSFSVCSVEHGDQVIKVTTLDSFVRNEGLERVDFIKMDIEGAELNALKGAARTIIRCKPELAISVYHLPGDIHEIPFFIKSLVPEYKLYLSHKCRDWCETKLFASIR